MLGRSKHCLHTQVSAVIYGRVGAVRPPDRRSVGSRDIRICARYSRQQYVMLQRQCCMPCARQQNAKAGSGGAMLCTTQQRDTGKGKGTYNTKQGTPASMLKSNSKMQAAGCCAVLSPSTPVLQATCCCCHGLQCYG